MKRLSAIMPILLFVPALSFAATYEELKTALGNQALKDKVEVAILVTVDKIIDGTDTGGGFDGTNHANRLIWARRIMSDPEGSAKEAARFFPLIIAAKRAASLAAILGASDAAVQTNVEETVDLFSDGT